MSDWDDASTGWARRDDFEELKLEVESMDDEWPGGTGMFLLRKSQGNGRSRLET